MSMTQAELHDRLWAAAEPSLYCTKEEYLAGLAGWEIAPHVENGETVGAVVVKDHELHFVTWGQWKLTRQTICHYLEPILAEHGMVTTKTPHGSTRQQRFNRILGFEQTGEDEFFIHFALRHHPFARKATCP